MPEHFGRPERPSPIALPRPSKLPKAENFGYLSSVGVTYTQLGQATSLNWRLDLRLANRVTGMIKVRIYRAANGWTAGEPTGATLRAAWAYDLIIRPGGVYHIDDLMLLRGEKVVVRSDTASSLDVVAQGAMIA